MIGGFYTWHLAFNAHPLWTGEFTYTKSKFGKLKDYDIIYVCLAKPEVDGHIATLIRDEIGYKKDSPLLVGAVDYAVEIWDQPFNPLGVREQLAQCDVILASEPALTSSLNALMRERKVHTVPHPSNLDFLKAHKKDVSQRQFNISCMIHRYDNNWKAIFATVFDVIRRKQSGEEMPDLEAIVLAGDKQSEIELMPFFGKVSFGDMYSKQMEHLSRQLMCVDSYHRLHTYGRTVVDCAAIGLPLVGTKLQYLQQKLFPALTTQSYDLCAQQDIIQRLIKDKDFYKEVVDYAFKRVDEYGLIPSAERFMYAMMSENEGIANKLQGAYLGQKPPSYMESNEDTIDEYLAILKENAQKEIAKQTIKITN